MRGGGRGLRDRFRRAADKQRRDVTSRRRRDEEIASAKPGDADETIIRCISLLRAMSAEDWLVIDGTTGEEAADFDGEDLVGEAVGDDIDVHEQQSSPNIYDRLGINGAMDVEPNSASSGLLIVDDLLDKVRRGACRPLSTNDFNLLLFRITLAPDLSSDEVFELMLTTYRLMVQLSDVVDDRVNDVHDDDDDDDDDDNDDAVIGYKHNTCAPDETTVEIMILMTRRRLAAYHTGVDLVKDFVARQKERPRLLDHVGGSSGEGDPALSSIWNEFSLQEAVRLCERRNEYELAQNLVHSILQDERRLFRIPVSVFHSMIDMSKRQHRSDDAIHWLRICLQVSASVVSKTRTLFICLVWLDSTSYFWNVVDINTGTRQKIR